MVTKNLKEMDDAYANGVGVAAVPAAPTEVEFSTDVTVENPPVETQRRVTVYADKITSVSYDDKDPVASFDISFFVGITDADGSTKTHQVVKRIGINKEKIASEAASTAQVSIVESQKMPEKHHWSMNDMVRIAGIK